MAWSPDGYVPAALLGVLIVASGAARAADPGPPAPRTPRADPADGVATEPKRLINFLSVGFSDNDGLGRVSPHVVSEIDGWQAYVDNTLAPLVEYLGPGRFDMWLSNPGGVWDDLVPLQLTATKETYTLFEQMAIARDRFPQLAEYGPLATYAHANGVDLFAYIGLPRCDDDDPDFVFDPQPDHCNAAMFDHWYGDFVTYGFKGIGHDFSATLAATSDAFAVNFPMVQAEGIDVYVESVPWWSSSQFLGLGVVAEEWLWENAEQFPENHMQEQTILDAGGRSIHLVLRPHPSFPVHNLQQWRFLKAKQLLEEGKTIAVPLKPLLLAGHPIEQLANLAEGLPAEDPVELPSLPITFQKKPANRPVTADSR
ncbi:MAG: hypothetical protein GY715_12660 [Planctomycetes bacterium]|nr:hypothetical protein [Planctomycetota bacterium]